MIQITFVLNALPKQEIKVWETGQARKFVNMFVLLIGQHKTMMLGAYAFFEKSYSVYLCCDL